MVSAAEISLQIMEVTAILLPLMGIFAQVFIRQIALRDIGRNRTAAAYILVALTAAVIVFSGITAVLPFLEASTSTVVFVPLFLLYLGYAGVGILIALLPVLAPPEEADLDPGAVFSDWLPDFGAENDE